MVLDIYGFRIQRPSPNPPFYGMSGPWLLFCGMKFSVCPRDKAEKVRVQGIASK